MAAELDSFDGRKDPERCTLLGELDLALAMIGLYRKYLSTLKTYCVLKNKF